MTFPRIYLKGSAAFVKRFTKKYSVELKVLAFFTLIVAVFYGNTLQNGFVHDDVGQIKDNPYMHSLVYLPKVFTGCIWESALGGCNSVTSYYRPTQYLSYLLTYQISPNPWIFHLVNLIYYITCGFLVFITARLLTKKIIAGFVAGLIFLIHPINLEIVNWAASVPELLLLIFSLLSTSFYFRYRREENNKYLKFVYAFYALAVLSKETVVFLPLIFIILDFVYFKKTLKEYFAFDNLKPFFVLGGELFVFIALRFYVLGGLGLTNNLHMSPIQYLYIYTDLMYRYLVKVFYPYPFQFSYAMDPSYKDLKLEPLSVAVSILFTGVFFIVWKKKWRGIFFSLLWFIVFLSPVLLFISTIDVFGVNIFAERYLSIPVVGFCFITGILVSKIWYRYNLSKTLISFLLFSLVFVSFFVIFPQNKIFSNDVSVYEDTLKKNPLDDLTQYNLAIRYRESGKIAQAQELLEGVIKRGTWPQMQKAYNNLGDIYRSRGDTATAMNYFEKAIKINPNHESAYNNIGAIYLSKNDILNAVVNLCKAVKINPNFKDANTNLNIAASKIQHLDDEIFSYFYLQVIMGSVFKPYEGHALAFERQDCSYKEGCLNLFYASNPNEFFLPFLIGGQLESGQVIRATYFQANPKTSEVAIGIDKKYADKKIRFILPVCEKKYYEAITQ